MPALLSLLVLGILIQKPTPTDFPLPVGKPARSIREVMIDDLADPKVQASLGVSSTQTQLQNVRIAQEAMKLGFAMLRNSVSGEDKGLASNFSVGMTSSGCLFPFLNEPQIAKLRRLALRDEPLQALGTNEVAYALELTAAQRTQIDAIRTRYYAAYLNSDRPSVRNLKAAFTRIAASSAKAGGGENDSDPTPEDVDRTQALMNEIFKAFERSIRLSASEKPIPAPNVLRLLTPAQARRYRELSRV